MALLNTPVRFASLAIVLLVTTAVPAEGQLAKNHSRFLGNVYSTSQLPGFSTYWNQVTPENGGKWGTVEARRDEMNWTTMDAVAEFAAANGFPVRFHVLIWGNQQPRWIETLPAAEQLEEIEEWFAAVAERYPDLEWIEVVNEPLHDPPNRPDDGGGNYIEALGGTGASGWEWVLNAFRLARTHFPNAKLLINDYNIIGSDSNAQRYLQLVQLLQAENLIDGIGMQAHAFSTTGSEVVMKRNLDRLATTGLPIQITEMDVDGPSDLVQWQDYQRIFPVLWEHPAVEGVTLWGWRPGMWRTNFGAPLLKDNGSEKIALGWLRTYLRNVLAANEPSAEQPGAFELLQNYPNPFSSSTTIEYMNTTSGPVRLDVFDAFGRPVTTLVESFQAPGLQRVEWDGRDAAGNALASGFYLCRVTRSGGAEYATRPVLIVR